MSLLISLYGVLTRLYSMCNSILDNVLSLISLNGVLTRLYSM